MSGIDQAMRNVEAHRVATDALQIASPPVALRLIGRSTWTIAIDTLDEDQPVGVDRQDRVASAFSGQAPVEGRVSAAPAGRGMGFVVQVSANDHRIIFVVSG